MGRPRGRGGRRSEAQAGSLAIGWLARLVGGDCHVEGLVFFFCILLRNVPRWCGAEGSQVTYFPGVFRLDLARVCKAPREKAGTLGGFQDNHRKPNI